MALEMHSEIVVGKGRPGADQAAKDESVTGWLLAWRGGDSDALKHLMPAIHDEICQLARDRLQDAVGTSDELTLEATEVVQETYQRLADQDHPRWRDRSHFFAVAAVLTHRVVAERKRHRSAPKRPGKWTCVPAEALQLFDAPREQELLRIDRLLNQLTALDARKSRVVELRFVAGLTTEETASTLNLEPATVAREWRTARAWMLQEMDSKEV